MQESINTHALDNSHTHILTTDRSYHHFPKHYHETYSIAVLTDGAKDFRTNRLRCTLDGTNIVTMNPGEIHSGDSLTESGWKQIVVLFDGHSGRRFAEENSLRSKELIFGNIIKNDMAFRTGVLNLCRRIDGADTELEKEDHYESLMALLFSCEKMLGSKTAYINRAGIRRAVALMNDEPDTKHTLDSLSAAAGMSKFHFLRSFKEATGLTPHAYLNIMRVEKAKGLLLNSFFNITDIAQICGFADQAHLTRAYKKIYGTTPGALARK